MKSRMRLFSILICLAVFLALLFCLPWSRKGLEAATGVGIDLTNIAQVTWNSGAIVKTNEVTNSGLIVGTNYGVTWIGTATNSDFPAGSWITNYTTVSNEGNASAYIILTFNSNFAANTSSKIWSNLFSNVTDSSALTDMMVLNMSAGGVKNVSFYVFAPSDETNNASVTYQCLASNSNASIEIGARATNYFGFNNTNYGGYMGLYNAGPGNTWLTNPQTEFTNWLLTVKVADIAITKTAAFTNPDPFADPALYLTPVPGALITYEITYTNKGGMTGTGVSIVDTMPTNQIAYILGSMRRGYSITNTTTNYSGLAANTISDVPDLDDGCTNPTSAMQLVFAPTNSTAGPGAPAGGSVDAGISGSYFYQVWLK